MTNVVLFCCRDSGIFHIFVASDGEPSTRQVGRYEGSGSFGELALMYNMPRAATIQVRLVLTRRLAALSVSSDGAVTCDFGCRR